MDVCMNTVFYLRRHYKFTTKHMRRIWKRRKHHFEYILYLNVLSQWSAEYAFFRKNIKFTYSYCICKTSLLAYNLAGLRDAIFASATNSERAYLTSLPKTLVRYFTSSQIGTYFYWTGPVNTLLVFSSFYQNAQVPNMRKICAMSPSYVYSPSALAAYHDGWLKYQSSNYHALLIQPIVDYSYQLLTEIYKLHVMCVINLLRAAS